MTWRTIDSAPKDGTEILLSNGKAIGIGAWLGSYPSGFRCNDWFFNMLRNTPHRPTHWQPLPAPPGAKE